MKGGKYENAIKTYQTAIKILKGLYSIKHIKVAAAINDLGLAYLEKKDFVNAQESFERVMEITKEWDPRELPETVE